MAALEELDDLVGRHVRAVVLGLSGRRTQVRDADELGVVLVRVRVGVRVRDRVRRRATDRISLRPRAVARLPRASIYLVRVRARARLITTPHHHTPLDLLLLSPLPCR